MGHSTSSGRNTGRLSEELTAAEQAAGVRMATPEEESRFNQLMDELGRREQTERLAKRIDRAKISSVGNGNWQMDVDGVGGGQILDESDGALGMYGRGGKVYSVRAWDSGYNMIHETTIGGSLNDAKRELREALHRHYGTRG